MNFSGSEFDISDAVIRPTLKSIPIIVGGRSDAALAEQNMARGFECGAARAIQKCYPDSGF